MDEEKARAYYDEMCRKGGGAARLKHGLGYDGQTASGSVATFVKSDHRSEGLPEPEKESLIFAVREKLKKQDDGGGDKSAKRDVKYRSGDIEQTHKNRRHRSPNHSSSDSACGRFSSWNVSSERDTRSGLLACSKKIKASGCSNLITGYDCMTPAEKVKARMKSQLLEIAAKDSLKGMSSEWERFDFNRNAPLDDDAKLEYFGDGTQAVDDTGFLQNRGSTFSSSTSQARKEAQIQENHDMAMFGPPSNMPGSPKKLNDHANLALEKLDDTHKEENVLGISGLVSDQVLNMQNLSWRQRALRLKQQRSTNTID